MCLMTGFMPQTTFWDDFSIADIYGEFAIRDTYRRAFKAWKKDYQYLTELTMILNWKLWYWYESNEIYAEHYCKLYMELFEELDMWCVDNLKGHELTYFLRTVD